jgi:hypothetical protein
MGIPSISSSWKNTPSSRGARPKTPVVLMSGLVDHGLAGRTPIDELTRVLGKPFELQTLNAILQELLGRAS